MYNRLHMARFAVILEAYLKGCGEALLVYTIIIMGIMASMIFFHISISDKIHGSS